MKDVTNEELEYLSSELQKYDEGVETYKVAMDELEKKIAGLNRIFKDEKGCKLVGQENRTKSEASFINKQLRNRRKGLTGVNYEDMHDIIGFRLVCLTLSDIETYKKLIEESNLFSKIEVRDYIENPKKSGYRSMHLIVQFPIVINNQVKYINAEIQLRTIFMHIFAREEHKLSYKGNCSEEDKANLRELSTKLFDYDTKLNSEYLKYRESKEKKASEEADKKELALTAYERTFEHVSHIFDDVYADAEKLLSDLIKDFKEETNSEVIFKPDIKSIPSIRRKMKKKHLDCTTNNMLKGLKDIIRYKVVCVDEGVARVFIKNLIYSLQGNDRITIHDIKDFMDSPKSTGYRGLKITAKYELPPSQGYYTYFEIIVRSLFMEAWASHNDVVYTDDEEKGKYEEIHKEISTFLQSEEEKIKTMKETTVEVVDDELLKIVRSYMEKKKKGLS